MAAKSMSAKPMNELERRICDAEEELRGVQQRLRELHQAMPEQEVEDYRFDTPEGEVRLSALFGRHQELLLVHNMGSGCPYCTLWADGFNGMLPHFENRAGFAVISKDPPEAQRNFARSRGWRFRMASAERSPFTKDMGFESDGYPMPGVSTFRKDLAGRITRKTRAGFSPGDLYCSLWHLFDLLPFGAEGRDGWHPRFHY